ncbi:serpentine type 7TM GPCR chemoreceptor str domain-containing protein [Ditylenchus destructor]|uniref:Serpentine type 7TM GPCR chemoreceptor str domain-containing protein n=1 Tax=Ditylenchus destructor TaxID=166010 RepID=A0AAD4N898_9BILA|nr:serpentine type 7TM GPCR chemoreceptor str domain-containing protein [Ditylenchus destructor]
MPNSSASIVRLSENFSDGTSFVAYVNLLLLICSYSLLIWVCLTKSPRLMSGYKWLIIVNATCCLFYELLNTLTMPELLSPYPIIIVQGPFKHLLSSNTLLYIYFDSFVFAMVILLYTNSLLFVYRYCQTVNNWIYERIFSYWILSMGICILPLMMIYVPVVALLHPMIGTSDRLMETLSDDIKTQQSLKHCVLVGLAGSHVRLTLTYVTLFAASVGVFITSIVVYTTFETYRFLQHRQNILGSRKAALYLALMNSLVIELIIGVVIIVIPFFLALISYLAESSYSSVIVSTSLRLSGLYPVCSNIILMYNVRSYRNAVFALLKRIIVFVITPSHVFPDMSLMKYIGTRSTQ